MRFIRNRNLNRPFADALDEGWHRSVYLEITAIGKYRIGDIYADSGHEAKRALAGLLRATAEELSPIVPRLNTEVPDGEQT